MQITICMWSRALPCSHLQSAYYTKCNYNLRAQTQTKKKRLEENETTSRKLSAGNPVEIDDDAMCSRALNEIGVGPLGYHQCILIPENLNMQDKNHFGKEEIMAFCVTHLIINSYFLDYFLLIGSLQLDYAEICGHLSLNLRTQEHENLLAPADMKVRH